MAGIQVVAGGAGFIGSSLVAALLRAETSQIIVLDDLSLGRAEYLRDSLAGGRVSLIACDVSNRDEVSRVLKTVAQRDAISEIWHLAANSDIPAGIVDPDVDFNRTFRTTYELLRLSRE